MRPDLFFLYQMSGGFKQSRLRLQRNTGAVVSDVGGGGVLPVSTGSGESSTSTGTTGSSTGTGTGTGTNQTTGSSTGTTNEGASDDLRTGDWATLRTKYETAKQRAAILDSLGIPETEVGGAVKQFTAIKTEAFSLAKELGYEDVEDVKAAFEKDPIAMLNLLRKEKAEAATQSTVQRESGESQVDYEARIREEVAKQTKPFTEHINKQISDAVTAKIGTEFHTAYTSVLPNTPPEVRSIVEDYVTEYLTHNTGALIAMKTKGDYSSVTDAVKIVGNRLKDAFSKWVTAESGRTGQRTSASSHNGGTGTGTKRPTLDEMIADPSLINSKYAD